MVYIRLSEPVMPLTLVFLLLIYEKKVDRVILFFSLPNSWHYDRILLWSELVLRFTYSLNAAVEKRKSG